MLQRLLDLDQWLEKVETLLAIALYALLIAAVAVNVVARNLLHLGSPFLLEVAPALVLWLALVGATLGLKRGRHITIGALLRLLPPRGRNAAAAATSLAGLLVAAALCYASVLFLQNELILFGALGLRSACLPLFFLMVFLRSALRFWTRWRSLPDAA
ncbi:MAG: TRAP transporter small permease subunit [Desulfobacterales bacterium]|nr:TRAP transporter small permease subunit [Desulfobacterales bacterium]